jgi:hypothetical protein
MGSISPNIQQAAFTRKDPKRAIKLLNLTVLTVCRMLVKLTHGVELKHVFVGISRSYFTFIRGPFVYDIFASKQVLFE